ncbi:unnamed protein product [Wickerhamomyces anomalus]
MSTSSRDGSEKPSSIQTTEVAKDEAIISKDVIQESPTAKDPEKQQLPNPSPVQYSAFPQSRKNFILFLVTMAGFLGPVSGNIYIPILPQLQEVFQCSETTINATVSVFMAIFAISPLLWASWADFGGR